MNFLIAYPSVAVAAVLIVGTAVRLFLVPTDRKRTEWLLAVLAIALPADVIAEGTAGALSRLRPLKYDEFVYRIDGLFGQPSFVLGRLVEQHKSLVMLVSVSYGLLPMVIVVVFATYLWRRTEAESLRVLWAFALNLFAAVPLYLLFPVCGPRFAFLNFPDHALLVGTPHLLTIAAAPNGVPSVHTSSALLILWFLRPWRWGRYFGAAFLALTVLATLGSGQHYLFDLLTAVPYAAAVVWFTCGRLHIPYSQNSAIQLVPTQ